MVELQLTTIFKQHTMMIQKAKVRFKVYIIFLFRNVLLGANQVMSVNYSQMKMKKHLEYKSNVLLCHLVQFDFNLIVTNFYLAYTSSSYSWRTIKPKTQ